MLTLPNRSSSHGHFCCHDAHDTRATRMHQHHRDPSPPRRAVTTVTAILLALRSMHMHLPLLAARTPRTRFIPPTRFTWTVRAAAAAPAPGQPAALRMRIPQPQAQTPFRSRRASFPCTHRNNIQRSRAYSPDPVTGTGRSGAVRAEWGTCVLTLTLFTTPALGQGPQQHRLLLLHQHRQHGA
jgi:hypothetical protein